jgi:hypothetical protein
MLVVLRAVTPPIVVLEEIEAFLRQADLVKFARLTPSEDECAEALARGERIVMRTVPPVVEARPARPVVAGGAA